MIFLPGWFFQIPHIQVLIACLKWPQHQTYLSKVIIMFIQLQKNFIQLCKMFKISGIPEVAVCKDPSPNSSRGNLEQTFLHSEVHSRIWMPLVINHKLKQTTSNTNLVSRDLFFISFRWIHCILQKLENTIRFFILLNEGRNGKDRRVHWQSVLQGLQQIHSDMSPSLRVVSI